MNNQKPVMVAVRDKATRDQLSAMNAAVMGTDRDPFYGAPCVIVVLADPTLSHMGGRRFSGAGESGSTPPTPWSWALLDQPSPGDVRHRGGQGASSPVGHPGTLPGHRLLHSGLRRRGSRPQGAGSQPHLENLTKEKNDGLSGNCPRRQSCRSYDTERPVEQEKLDAVLEAARLAPSACNAQPYTHRRRGRPAKAASRCDRMGMNKFAAQAPVLIVISERPTPRAPLWVPR